MANKIFSYLTDKKKIEVANLTVEDFAACCTAQIICDFGQESGNPATGHSTESIIAACNNIIPELKKDGFGVAVAITTDNQKKAAEALTRLGFYSSPKPMKKSRNTHTGDLTIWFMPTHEFTPVKL